MAVNEAQRARNVSPAERKRRAEDILPSIGDQFPGLAALAEEDSERVTLEIHEADGRVITTTTGHAVNTAVVHPVHYNSDPSGVECIEVVRHRNFNIGNAIKYLWRAGLKVLGTKSARESEIQDIKKAIWYLRDEVTRLGGDPDAP